MEIHDGGRDVNNTVWEQMHRQFDNGTDNHNLRRGQDIFQTDYIAAVHCEGSWPHSSVILLDGIKSELNLWHGSTLSTHTYIRKSDLLLDMYSLQTIGNVPFSLKHSQHTCCLHASLQEMSTRKIAINSPGKSVDFQRS